MALICWKILAEVEISLALSFNMDDPQSSTVLTFGKWRGKTFSEILSEDPSYCRWSLSQTASYGGMLAFQDFLRRPENTFFSVGKHVGKTFSQVLHEERRYCTWVKRVTNPNGEIKKFKDFIESQPELSPAARKKRKIDNYAADSFLKATQEAGLPQKFAEAAMVRAVESVGLPSSGERGGGQCNCRDDRCCLSTHNGWHNIVVRHRHDTPRAAIVVAVAATPAHTSYDGYFIPERIPARKGYRAVQLISEGSAGESACGHEGLIPYATHPSIRCTEVSTKFMAQLSLDDLQSIPVTSANKKKVVALYASLHPDDHHQPAAADKPKKKKMKAGRKRKACDVEGEESWDGDE